jgi:PTS system mannitol-specific IIA component
VIVVRVDLPSVDRMAAVHRCADVLERIGAVTPGYRAAMVARERAFPSYLGEGVAIPYGPGDLVRQEALAILQFPGGVDWAGHHVVVCVAIAAGDDSHVELLSSVAAMLLDPARAARLRAARHPDEIMRMFCVWP